MKIKITSVLIGLIVLCLDSNAQTTARSVISSSGGQGDLANGRTIDWTLGEASISTIRIDELTLRQGFQQPANSTTTSVSLPISNIGISIYPNPFSHSLYLESDSAEKLQGNIIDIFGRKLNSFQIFGNQSIDLSGLESGTYFLTILKEKLTLSTSIIQKIQ